MLVECSAATGFTRYRRFEIQSCGKGRQHFPDDLLFYFEEQYQRVVFVTTVEKLRLR
jgi:hypothetical protein